MEKTKLTLELEEYGADLVGLYENSRSWNEKEIKAHKALIKDCLTNIVRIVEQGGVIPQKHINSSEEIAERIMKHLFGKKDTGGLDGWDSGSPAHKFWKRYCKKHFRSLNRCLGQKFIKLPEKKARK